MEEKIFFKSRDGIRLCGVLSKPSKETRKCIVLCHGITVDKDEGGMFVELSKRLVGVGFAAFRFDFRGHGESGGNSVDMTVSGEEMDLEAAVDTLKNDGYSEFGICGASFAGGPVSFFSSNNQPLVKTLVFWYPLIDYEELINPTTPVNKKYFGKAAFGKIEKLGFMEIGSRRFKIGKPLANEILVLKPWKELLNLDIPVLFIHGDKDTYVPYEHSVKYSKMLKNAKLETVEGQDHGFDDEKSFESVSKSTVKFFLKNM